jgi:hypothetical protein
VILNPGTCAPACVARVRHIHQETSLCLQKNTAVFGIYSSGEHAERAVDTLIAAGLGVGGAVGGLLGALVGMGIPEYEAKRYEGRVKGGGTLLSVHCDTSAQISRAKDLLKSSGADDIASTGESASTEPASAPVR